MAKFSLVIKISIPSLPFVSNIKSISAFTFLNQEENFYNPYFENIKNNIFNLIKLLKNIKELLKFLTVPEKSIILIGGNGSRKSSLADYLKDNFLGNIVIFPASKNLFFNIDTYEGTSFNTKDV